jgi:hypothetical protein
MQEFTAQPEPTRKPHLARNIGLAAVVVVIGLIVVVFLAGFLYGLSGGTVSPTGPKDTWQQFGMTIQYPSGLKAQTQGALEQQATSDSGVVDWGWNHGQTSLGILWLTTPTYSVTAGFQGIEQKLQAYSPNFVTLDQGSTNMSGHTWQYRTYSLVLNGTTDYFTYAISYYSVSGRAYILYYGDVNSNTVTSLAIYGDTFTG